MDENIPRKKPWYKRWFTKKKIIVYVILLLVAGFFVFRGKGQNSGDIQTEIVKKMDLKRTVLTTGQVTSQTDLSLSFKTSGIVSKVYVKVGDTAKSGQILANLEQKDQQAQLTQAKGALAQAMANYQKVLNGAGSEDITVSQVALDNAKISLENTKAQQKVLVDNAYKTLLNSTLEAVPDSTNINNITLSITGTYESLDHGIYQIIQEGKSFYVKGLENAGNLSFGSSVAYPQPLGTKGLYVTFPITMQTANDKWTVTIPNIKASNYSTNYNAYQAALETQRSAVSAAESAVASAQAALDLKKAKARPADLEVAEAQILSAQGQVQAAEASLENTSIRAPADGTITKADIKPGELATAMQEVLILQDVQNLHVESNVSEANIALIEPGQQAEVTFDALGMDRVFNAKVQEVDPASTVISGVVNYKITVGLENRPEIKPGMTANLTVLTSQKAGVLAVPQRAVINKDNKKFVRVITDAKKKTYEETQISTGLEADGGVVEILEGLSEGQEIVTFIKTK
jgi:HlyD family secretion protein